MSQNFDDTRDKSPIYRVTLRPGLVYFFGVVPLPAGQAETWQNWHSRLEKVAEIHN